MKTSKPIKRGNRPRRKGRRANPVAVLDKRTRREVVEDRDQNTCQRCGVRHGEVDAEGRQVVIQWSHIISRRIHSVRWNHDNSMAKCDRCHTWFTHNHTQGCYWFASRWPDRWERINALVQNTPKLTAKDLKEMAANV